VSVKCKMFVTLSSLSSSTLATLCASATFCPLHSLTHSKGAHCHCGPWQQQPQRHWQWPQCQLNCQCLTTTQPPVVLEFLSSASTFSSSAAGRPTPTTSQLTSVTGAISTTPSPALATGSAQLSPTLPAPTASSSVSPSAGQGSPSPALTHWRSAAVAPPVLQSNSQWQWQWGGEQRLCCCQCLPPCLPFPCRLCLCHWRCCPHLHSLLQGWQWCKQWW